MLYFDANACIGQRPFKHKRTRWSTEHLLEDMELAEISGALVSHGLAQSYDPLYGNGRLVAEIKKAPDKLFPLWCILPLGSVDFYACGEEMLRAMEETGVRAVRLVQGNYSLHEAVMGETFVALQETKTLTLLSAAWGGGDLFAFFHELLSRHPRLPVLLTDHTWSQQRHVHRLMQLHENLYIEFSAYQINRGLERYTAEFGDERLLFGTGGTEKSLGAARTFVDYAQIPPESKERIAGGNLRRLLKEQGPRRRHLRSVLAMSVWPMRARGEGSRPLSTMRTRTFCTRAVRAPASIISCTMAMQRACSKSMRGAASTGLP